MAYATTGPTEPRRPARRKVDELARRAGVSPRTMRYCVPRGIVPGPEFRGPDTVYTDEHLMRLLAIRVLRERHLPLDATQAALVARSPAALARIAEGEVPPEPFRVAPQVGAPVASEAPVLGSRQRRVVLAPGLELHLDQSANATVAALAEATRREAARLTRARHGKPSPRSFTR